jgi:PAS domain S-box-containing protein
MGPVTVGHQFLDRMTCRINILLQNTIFRYLFGIAAVASAFIVRMGLVRLTGTGAPFVLFFGAVVVTSLFAGAGPAICAVLLSMPLGAYISVMGTGSSVVQASFQSLLFAVDGIAVVYVTSLTKKRARSLENASRKESESEEKYRALFDSIDEGFCVVEVLFDDAAKPVDYRFLDVNRVFEKQTGIKNAVGRRMREIAPAHEEHWFQIFGQIALTGESRRFENPAHALGRFYDVYAFRLGRPAQRHVAILFNDITERKQAEESLRSVSAELRKTLQIAATGLTHCSQDLRHLSANRAYAQFVGVPQEQIVGKSIVKVMGQAAFEIIRPRIERVLRGERVEFEDELPIAGERKSIHGVYTPDRNASGHVVGWVASITDISEFKRIEKELKAANAFLDAIIEHIPLVLFLKDAESLRYVRLNRAGEELLGWPKHTFIGKSDHDLWPPAQAEFFVEKDRETLQGKMIDVAEESIQTHYQGVRTLHTKKVPILDTAGHPLYLLGISEDITERKRIEKEQRFLAEVSVALSASLEYDQTLASVARLAVQNVADWSAVQVIDEEGQLGLVKVASANPDQAALCAILEHMPRDRDLPHLMQSVIDSKRPVVVDRVTRQYIESVARGPAHLQALMATGITSFVAVPLLMRGQPLGALLLGSSTLTHVMGQSDLRLAEALAHRAATAIENARLYRSSVYATQLRDQVLGVVAHDLRNPLSAILAQLWALKRHRGTESERRSMKPAEVIERAAKRMNRLIQDLLDVAVLESGQLTIERTQLAPRDLIVGAVEMQKPLASSSSLELRVDVGDLPAIWGDKDRLLQVFENLIGNAIKFTKAGGSITVGAASQDQEVTFRVADTGSGIAPENLPRVFDRFWQASASGRSGAGLGLPITKGIVEAHRGRIWVESVAGSGSTFFFTIPTTFGAQDRLSDRGQPDRVPVGTVA